MNCTSSGNKIKQNLVLYHTSLWTGCPKAQCNTVSYWQHSQYRKMWQPECSQQELRYIHRQQKFFYYEDLLPRSPEFILVLFHKKDWNKLFFNEIRILSHSSHQGCFMFSVRIHVISHHLTEYCKCKAEQNCGENSTKIQGFWRNSITDTVLLIPLHLHPSL